MYAIILLFNRYAHSAEPHFRGSYDLMIDGNNARMQLVEVSWLPLGAENRARRSENRSMEGPGGLLEASWQLWKAL